MSVAMNPSLNGVYQTEVPFQEILTRTQSKLSNSRLSSLKSVVIVFSCWVDSKKFNTEDSLAQAMLFNHSISNLTTLIRNNVNKINNELKYFTKFYNVSLNIKGITAENENWFLFQEVHGNSKSVCFSSGDVTFFRENFS